MPLYHFTCSGCLQRSRRILKATEVKGHKCKDCGETLERDPQPPSTQVIESLDNGLMPRRLERLRDAEVLFKERARNDPRIKRED